MIFYPTTLPCVSKSEGLSAAVSAGVVRTPMEAGNTRQRRMQRVLPHRFSLTFIVSQLELAAWLAWCNAHAWDDWVLLLLPGLHASQAGALTVLTPVRFISDVSKELLPGHGLWYWRVRVDAEYLPTVADLTPLPFAAWIAAGRPASVAPDWIVAGRPGSPSPWSLFSSGAPS